MSELLVLAAIFVVPSLAGIGLGLLRRGWVVAFALSGAALSIGLILLANPPDRTDQLGHAVLTNLAFLVAAELAGGWMLAALGRVWHGKRAT